MRRKGVQTLLLSVCAACLQSALPGQELVQFEVQHAARSTPPQAKRALVSVLVERRLWSSPALRKSLEIFLEDLRRDGYRSMLETVHFKKSATEQDGRYILALRQHLIDLSARRKPLAGAILVGHFPDAMLVRTVNWRKKGKIVLHKTGKQERRASYEHAYLRRVPEIVADRCDLVLADLDGNWDAVYRQERQQLQTCYAVFPGAVPAVSGQARDLELGLWQHADFFHVNDGRLRADAKTRKIVIDDAHRDRETSAADRRAANPIARPEISISRIDARGVAWSKRKPGKAAQQPEKRKTRKQSFFQAWQPDPALEIRLLVEYFARNHSYRQSTQPPAAFQPASFAWKLPSGMHELERASPRWKGFRQHKGAQNLDIRKQANLATLVDWLKRPALLRFIAGHSNGYFTGFGPCKPADLRTALAGDVSSEPAETIAHAKNGHADFAFYRSLWSNGVLPSQPYLLIHVGCELLSPPAARKLAFDNPRYGARQNGESQLFFTPALAIVGRSKVFYDQPRGFCQALAEGKNFGEALQRYYALEAAAKTWKQVGGDIGRKRSYFWAILGDWTLRLNPRSD